MAKRNKISLIGAGNIGGTLAHLIGLKNLGDIVILDVQPDMPAGKALDIEQSSVVSQFDSKIIGTKSYEDIAESDVIIVYSRYSKKTWHESR